MDHTGLSGLLTNVLSGHGLELDDLEVAPAGRRRVVRVTVDGDGSRGRGPDLDQIAAATRSISEALDESDAMGDTPYTLEVSSRGVGRPLVRPAHYRRNMGRLLTITQVSGEQVTGRITAADGLGVSLDVDGTPLTVPFDQVKRAAVQVEMNRRLDEDDDLDDGSDEAADGPDEERTRGE